MKIKKIKNQDIVLIETSHAGLKAFFMGHPQKGVPTCIFIGGRAINALPLKTKNSLYQKLRGKKIGETVCNRFPKKGDHTILSGKIKDIISPEDNKIKIF